GLNSERWVPGWPRSPEGRRPTRSASVPSRERKVSRRAEPRSFSRVRGLFQQPALAKHRRHALAECVRLLDVRVPGKDELVDPELVVFGDAIRHLVVAADERRAGAAAQQARACPEGGINLEVVALA